MSRTSHLGIIRLSAALDRLLPTIDAEGVPQTRSRERQSGLTPKKPPKVAASGPLTCRSCRKSAPIIAIRQRGKMLELQISCSKILGGCGRWLECAEATAEASGAV